MRVYDRLICFLLSPVSLLPRGPKDDLTANTVPGGAEGEHDVGRGRDRHLGNVETGRTSKFFPFLFRFLRLVWTAKRQACFSKTRGISRDLCMSWHYPLLPLALLPLHQHRLSTPTIPTVVLSSLCRTSTTYILIHFHIRHRIRNLRRT